MTPAIWRKQSDEWTPLLPSGFPSEEALHDLAEEAPHLLSLSGDPTLVVVGREVSVGPGVADLIAVDVDGQLTIIEIKLRKNSEAKRAVVAQILMYAAYLKGLDPTELEDQVLRQHLNKRDHASLVDAVRKSDQSGEFDPTAFADGLAESLSAGAFRLVLVLDEAPSELVQLFGYLESISSGVTLDLVTVSAYEAGDEQILVPQRVDPDYVPAVVGPVARPSRGRKPNTVLDGADAFERGIDGAAESDQGELRRLLGWARQLESSRTATLKSVIAPEREILLVWVPGQKGGLVSIWNDRGAYISLWRSVFVRLAWEHIAAIESVTGAAIGQGNTFKNPSDELLDLLAAAYRDAASGAPTWNGRDYYVAFGQNEQRNWEEAREFGFVSGGGGEWYSNTLRQLKPGHRVFAYIPQGSGVGGYVGVGEVTSEAVMARDFSVERDGTRVPYLSVTASPEASQYRDDPAMAEWIVPVRWIATRATSEAIRDSDFFANQNTAVKFRHGYTLDRLCEAFGVETTDSA